MTKGDLIFECSRALGLDDTAGSDELILMQMWASRGVIDVLVRTKCYVELGDMTLTAGQTDYRIDTSILAIENVHITSAIDTSQKSSILLTDMQTVDEYLNSNPASSDPTMVAFYETLMRVAPTPSGANVIRFYYVPMPTSMGTDGTKGSDTNDPSTATYGGVPVEYHEAILYFMLWKGSEYDDKQAALNPKEYRRGYEGLIADIRKQGRRKSGKQMNKARVGYPTRSRFPYSRNDVYPEYNR
jgi:hypothetical protein